MTRVPPRSTASDLPRPPTGYVPVAHGWFGTPPEAVGRGLDDQLSAVLWRVNTGGPIEVSATIPSGTHLVCAHLAGHMDWHARMPDRRYARPCRAGTATYARPGEQAEIVLGNARLSFVHFYLPDAWLRSRVSELAPRSRSGEFELIDPMNAPSESIAHAARLAARALTSADGGSRLEVEAAGLLLAAALVRHHSNAPRRPTRAAGGLAPHVLTRVTDYMSGRLAHDLSIGELAAVAQLSPFHFVRCFHASTGRTPHAWLRARRIERARELLSARPHSPRLEVALEVGYTSESGFAVAFRRETGLSLAAWCRGARNGLRTAYRP